MNTTKSSLIALLFFPFMVYGCGRLKPIEEFPSREFRDQLVLEVILVECLKRSGKLPSNSEGFSVLLKGENGFGKIINKLPTDAWGDEYKYLKIGDEITIHSEGEDSSGSHDDWIFKYSVRKLEDKIRKSLVPNADDLAE
jgi:hypothetical protein